MDNEKTKLYDWPRVLGFIGVTLSLIFVGIELQMSRTATEMAYSGDSSNRSLEYRAALAEHADIWVRGCRGEELSSEEDFVFHSLVLAFVIEIQDSISRMRALGEFDSETFFTDLAALNVYRYPGIRRALDGLLDWELLSSERSLLDPDIVTAVRRRANELEVAGVDPEGNPNFCGVVW